MRRLALLFAVLLLACAPFAPAPPQPAAPAPPPAGPTEPPPPRMLEGAELAGALPPRDDLVPCGERVCWRARSGVEYAILRARERDWLELETELGPLHSSWGLLAPSNTDPLRDLPQMLLNARNAGLHAEDLVFYEEELSGGYLVGSHLYVIREGVLREIGRADLAARSRKEHAQARERVERAIAAVIESLPRAKLEPESRPAVASILAQIPLEDTQTNLDYAPPSFVRRLVRFGWLAALGAPAGPCDELRRAVLEAEKLRPVARYASRDSTFELVEDAYGTRIWTLATPRRVGYSRIAAPPAYYTNGKSTRLVVHLPVGSDPLRDAARFESAEVYAGPDRLAAWDPAHGLSADDVSWRAAFPTKGEGVEWAALADALPPHVLVTAPNGDLFALATRFGVVHPAPGGSPKEAEKFYAEAAAALPDAAHLDLIGEYLLIYAFDSPDPRNPALLGTRTVSGDIHQTAEQTLATTAGGMMRGDCDDLSELDQEIAERQGRNAQMIGLPAHAALAWADRQPDGSWLTYILQTGQPLAFPGATLPDSLELTYKSFGSSELFDRTKLEILLRFSGENTRSSWYLSWRIFADPEYARTMIDVQRDWHFQTYQRAIVKMTDRIASGDQDPANYTELAGLYHYTGQYQLAADALVEAVARSDPGQTRVSMEIDRVVALASAGKKDEARALARELREHEIPELEDKMGLRLAEAKLSLADSVMVENCDPALALEILANDVTPETVSAIDTLVESLKKKDIDMESWRLQTEPVRDRVRWYVSSSIALLFATREGELADSAARAVLTGTSLRWLNELGFRELDPAESPLSRYAVLGRLLEATSDPNEVLARIEAAPLPDPPVIDHTQRGSGPEQLARDFSFIRISPAFWSSEIAALFAKEKKSLDPARVAYLAQRAVKARDEADSLGLDHRSFEHELREIRLVTALVEGDEPKLRAELRDIKQENDRRIRMNAASWIATVARFQTVPRFARIVEIWREEVDYKPMWFWIAWNAALAGATDHALLVARTAARENRDDRAFVEEYQFMQRRFTGPQAGGTPQPASAKPRTPPESLRRSGTGSPASWSVPTPARAGNTVRAGWPWRPSSPAPPPTE